MRNLEKKIQSGGCRHLEFFAVSEFRTFRYHDSLV